MLVAFQLEQRSGEREVCFETVYTGVLNPLQSGPECTLGDLGVLMLKDM